MTTRAQRYYYKRKLKNPIKEPNFDCVHCRFTGKCTVLNGLYCTIGDCSLYKTLEEAKRSRTSDKVQPLNNETR